MEAACVSCGHDTKPNVITGWSICKPCQKIEPTDFTFLNTELHTSGGREFVRGWIKAYLKQQKKKGAA